MNPKLGDVGFKVGKRAYILNMGVNALCCVEQAGGEEALAVVQRLADSLPKTPAPGAPYVPPEKSPRFSDIRLLFWAGLQRHQPTIDLTAAGDLVQEVNRGETKAVFMILESMQLCSPLPSDDEEAGDEAGSGPPQGEGGTGTPSS